MKKLLYITTNIQNSGGVSRILSVKLNYLIEIYNYRITVLNSNNTNNGFFYEFNSRINFYSLNTKHLFKYKKELNNIINKVEPDIIINCDNGFKGSLLPYLIKDKVPLIYERHCSKNISVATYKELLKLKASVFLLEYSINKYKNFIVLNNEERNDWSSENVKVILNPLWFKLKAESKKSNSKIVIAVGRHSYEKRYDKLIKIWEKVVEKHPDWILRIYGEKNSKFPLEDIVFKQNLVKNIQFHNPINSIDKIYSNATMLLSTSESESFGLVLIEAMAFAVPVIAFERTSGSRTIVDNGVNGFLVKHNDMKDYIEKVNLLIENKSLRKQMGENAIRSLKSFNIDSIMLLWHNLFQTI